jgi:cytochrome oxidase Cu insertion factor (SCO1/SenC/PrrC family)
MMRTQDRWPLSALTFLLVATVAWWALALWPLPSDTPQWLERARAVCFNVTETGLPDASGWVLLVGQPIGMVAVLLVGWRDEVLDALRHLASTARGRLLARTVTLTLFLGLSAAAVRVASAGVAEPQLIGSGDVPDTYPRLDRPFPHVEGLVDQHGAPFSLASLDGRGALVTFAFAHCETICPLLVRSSLAVREELGPDMDLAVVALTLDPWRDTPGRLPAMAAQWSLPERDFVVSGSVEALETALDAWNVSRVRDPHSGDVTHPALVYVVEPDGTVAYASTGSPPQLEALARRMRVSGGSDPLGRSGRRSP